jgi:hypothetical protein
MEGVMDYPTVAGIRRKLDGGEWLLLGATWNARCNLLEVVQTRPAGLTSDARNRYRGFVNFVQSLFAHLVRHFRASDGYARLTEDEREALEAEVFQLPLSEDDIAEENEPGPSAAEERLFITKAGSVLERLTADQRYYLFRTWQLAERLSEAVNAPLSAAGEEERRNHEWQVREWSHHHVQMRVVLEALGASLKLPLRDRQRIASLLKVRFDDPSD